MTYDIAVIGAGAAGLSVAYGAARLGRRVALIEQGPMGGECLNTGCIPSKALLHEARQGTDWASARIRINEVIAAIAPADSEERYDGLGVEVIRGHAKFISRGELQVGERVVAARRIVIAIGSRPKIPYFYIGIPYFTSETVWGLEERPEHLLIIGGGPMGFEMAEAFAELGSKVTIAGRPLPREDPELAAPLIDALLTRGVTILTDRVVGAALGPVLFLEDGRQIRGTHVLVAAGREVNAFGLNPRAAGIVAGPDGFATDAGLRAIGGGGRIFAVGDCADPRGIGPQRYTHVAGAHAGIVLRRAVFRLPAKLATTPPVRAIHTAPELAQAGVTLAQAGKGARTLRTYFTDNDRAVSEGETAGLVKLVLDKKSRLVGAGIAGPQASEMIGLYALAIAQKTKLSALAGLVLPYPTRSEAGKRAISMFVGEKLFSKWPKLVAKLLAQLP